MLKKYRYLDTDVYVYVQTREKPKLLQHDRLAPLSWLRDGNSKPVAVINCSYFTNQYVLGCNQGDLRNDTHDQKGFYDLKIDTQGNYYLGQFKSWEYKDNIVAGFSPATVLIKDGKDTELISMAICDGTKLTKINPQSAIAITKDKKLLLIVSDGRSTKNRGLSGYELREFIKLHYNVELLCQLDGGGSSEMIVDGAIVNEPSDGRERNMWNGLALVEDEEMYDPLMSPFKEMCISQFDHDDYSHKGAYAWDITNGVVGDKAPYFAPCELKCVAIDTEYCFTWWQTTYKHKLADGSVDYVTMMFGHDETINAKVGMIISKGTQIGNMGEGGVAKGVHCHIEVAKGKFKEKWIRNEYGVYVLPNASLFSDIFFMDETTIIKYSKPNDKRFELLNKVKFKYVNSKSDDLITTLTSQLVEANKKIEQKEIELVKIQNEYTKVIKALDDIKKIVGGM